MNLAAPAVSPPRAAAVLLAVLWGGMPLYPSFIALLPIAPPGLSLLGPLPACVLLLAVALLTAWVATLLWHSYGRALFADRLVRAMGVYLASMSIASLFGFVPIVGAVFVVITLCACIGATAVRLYGADRRVALAMKYSLLSTSILATLTALFCWYTRTPPALYAIGNGRAIGTFVVPGELAGYLGMLLPFTIGVVLIDRSRRLRLVAAVALFFDLAAICATFSRAGIVGLVLAGSITAVILQPRLLAWVLGAAALAATQVHRVYNLHHNPAENFNRFSIWHSALRAIALFPLWGVGPGGFSRIYELVRIPGGEPGAFHAHNFLLTTWAETGLIGFCGLAVLWTTFLALFRERYRSADRRARLLGAAILAGFAATWLQSMVDVVQILFLGLWIPFMGMALAALEEPST